MGAGLSAIKPNLAIPIARVPQGDLEETVKAATISRSRGAEKSKTPATTSRKRPISSLYTIDEWVNKTTGMGGEGGGIIRGVNGVTR